ncbi:hypothetical protein TrLO_g5645 [Triparma laevis f. longispina]|uniref:AAA+ ATPase domain-containing protein n=2 Tax=Triparma laevis TaxID=1534972 RepID=A0A9W7CH28_9STRA|nr:hypothetical protein TrLO_g5645 [Triparma laevis f. longispina]
MKNIVIRFVVTALYLSQPLFLANSLAPCSGHGFTSTRADFSDLVNLDTKLSNLLPRSVPVLPPPTSSETTNMDGSSTKIYGSRTVAPLGPSSTVLYDYWDPLLGSFNVDGATPQNSPSRLSVTSTCYALKALKELSISGSFLRYVQEKVIETEWRENDFFQAPLVMNLLLDGDELRELSREQAEKVRGLANNLIEARPRRRRGDQQTYSSYIQYQITKSLVGMLLSVDGDDSFSKLSVSALPSELLGDLTLSVSRAFEVSRDELCRQVAYHTAGDDRTFDCTRLAYSILTYVVAGEGLGNKAGIFTGKMGGDEDDAIAGKGVKVNYRVVKQAVDVFMSCQLKDGTWPQGQSIYSTFNRKNTDVGNAFVFSCDTLGEMLKHLPSRDFSEHIEGIELMAGWCERNYVSDIVTVECDMVTKECWGKPRRGWVSNHFPPGTGATAWSTAQALIFLARARKVTRQLMNEVVLGEFEGVKSSGVNSQSWDNLVDTDIAPCVTLKKIIQQRVLDPRASTPSPLVGPAAFSSVLFGPPGTAKTTICKSVADALGWDFVVIDTATFLKDGLGDVSGRIKYVFDRLKALDRCVVLFDEIEEFCLDRETQGLGMESRMLTTALLTQLNDLRKQEGTVFFLATNRLRALDQAITRPGRFDMQLFVGTPNLRARVSLFSKKLVSSGLNLSAEHVADAAEVFESVLTEKWSAFGQFFNYIEADIFADGCLGMIGADGALDRTAVGDLVESQLVTLRSEDARSEYVDGFNLSRW